jgi:polysaccharide export outer membrane protein
MAFGGWQEGILPTHMLETGRTIKMRAQGCYRSTMIARRGRACLVALLAIASAWTSACLRKDFLPTDEEGKFVAYSEPRPFELADVKLDRDPKLVYHIGPHDVLRLDVRKDPTLSGDYAVTDEGNILVPNIGTIHVDDLTADQVQEQIDKLLAVYIHEPEVKVGIKEYRSKVVFVVGQVAKPGPLMMRADMMTLEEAIFGAGLPTSEAAMYRTLVVRPDLNRPIHYTVDLNDIIYKGKMRENILLRPNDRVYVPSRYSTNLRAMINEALGPYEDIQRARSNSVFLTK